MGRVFKEESVPLFLLSVHFPDVGLFSCLFCEESEENLKKNPDVRPFPVFFCHTKRGKLGEKVRIG